MSNSSPVSHFQAWKALNLFHILYFYTIHSCTLLLLLFETGFLSVAFSVLEFILYRPGFPWTYTDPLASASKMLTLKVAYCHHLAGIRFLIKWLKWQSYKQQLNGIWSRIKLVLTLNHSVYTFVALPSDSIQQKIRNSESCNCTIFLCALWTLRIWAST